MKLANVNNVEGRKNCRKS